MEETETQAHQTQEPTETRAALVAVVAVVLPQEMGLLEILLTQAHRKAIAVGMVLQEELQEMEAVVVVLQPQEETQLAAERQLEMLGMAVTELHLQLAEAA